MPLKGLSYREVARKLKKAGFTEVSQKGSHVKFAKETEEGRRTAIVPKHKEIALIKCCRNENSCNRMPACQELPFLTHYNFNFTQKYDHTHAWSLRAF